MMDDRFKLEVRLLRACSVTTTLQEQLLLLSAGDCTCRAVRCFVVTDPSSS
jgi:hypothetical protein